MGRIEKALQKSRESHAGHPVTPEAKSNGSAALPINDGLEATANIDISSLPVVVPDEDCLEKYRVVAAIKDSPERSAYKVLRTRVLQRLRASRYNIIGVTGAGPGEGKSLTAINFAYTLAQDVNNQVILIDLDLRRPSLHEYLGISPRHDLTSVLSGSVSLENALVCPNANRLAVLTNQVVQRESSEILSSPEMAEVMKQLRSYGQRTITIVDLPPALASDDVIAFSPLIDALLLVVGQGRCRRDDLRETQELLHDSEILGVVLNGSREKSATSGYYDYY